MRRANAQLQSDRRAEVAQQFAGADLSRGLFAVLEGMAHHYFAERPTEQALLCTEVMALEGGSR